MVFDKQDQWLITIAFALTLIAQAGLLFVFPTWIAVLAPAIALWPLAAISTLRSTDLLHRVCPKRRFLLGASLVMAALIAFALWRADSRPSLTISAMIFAPFLFVILGRLLASVIHEAAGTKL